MTQARPQSQSIEPEVLVTVTELGLNGLLSDELVGQVMRSYRVRQDELLAMLERQRQALAAASRELKGRLQLD